MKIILIISLTIYGIANLFAGGSDLFLLNQLPVYISILLVLSGILFFITVYAVLKEKSVLLLLTIVSTLLAFSLAIYNERILGLGHPSHHIIRGVLSIGIIYISYVWQKKPNNTVMK